MRRSRPDPAANSEGTGSFHLVNSPRLAMLLPAVLLDCSCSCGPFYPGAVPSSVLEVGKGVVLGQLLEGDLHPVRSHPLHLPGDDVGPLVQLLFGLLPVGYL